MKAQQLLEKNKTIAERSERFATSMKRSIQSKVIDALIIKKEKLENDIFEAQSFSLATDRNAGLKLMTVEECEERFISIINMEFELTLLEKEIEIKTNSYNAYFGAE